MEHYTDGKLNQDSIKSAKSALASLLDVSDNHFGTEDRGQFIKKLAAMSLSDKGLLCNKVGIRPIVDGRSHLMDENLVKAFDQYMENKPILIEDRNRQIKQKIDYQNPPESLAKLLN